MYKEALLELSGTRELFSRIGYESVQHPAFSLFTRQMKLFAYIWLPLHPRVLETCHLHPCRNTRAIHCTFNPYCPFRLRIPFLLRYLEFAAEQY